MRRALHRVSRELYECFPCLAKEGMKRTTWDKTDGMTNNSDEAETTKNIYTTEESILREQYANFKYILNRYQF